MAFGLSLGLGLGARSGTSLAAQVAALFGPSDTGYFYDTSDFSTLFQDSAGTIPVTAVGQPVGLQLDKSGNGHHRSQATSTKRPTLARHPLGGLRNLITYTEDLSNSIWLKESCSVVDLGGGAFKLREASGNPINAFYGHDFFYNSNVIPPVDYRILTIEARAAERTRLSIHGRSVTAWGWATIDLITGATIAGLSGGNLHVTILSTEALEDGWWRIVAKVEIVWTDAYGTFTLSPNLEGADNYGINYYGDGVSGVEVRFPQLEQSVSTSYQKVTSKYDVTESGVKDLYYLSYDGVDDSLSTAAFDWGTDKATLVAGYTRLNTAAAIVCEFGTNYVDYSHFSISVNDGLYLHASMANGNMLGHISHKAGWTSYVPVPDASVITATHDIAGDLSTLRRNGVAGSNGTGDKGGGNLGNYQMFFGARAGVAFFFNGREYSQFGINRLLTASEIDLVEKYTNSKTGAY